MDKMDIPTLNHHVGSTERVFIAHVNDLNDFYLHSELVRDSLLKLGQELYDEYSEALTKNSLGINETLNIGDYCACPSESEDWYRGLIRQIDSNGHAIVFKIDYGDVQYIPIQFLQPLHKRFIQLHRLAFHCSLVNLIKPLDGWSLKVIDEFRSRLTTTFLYAKFINYNEIRDISEVEITEKSSKTSLNKDFQQYQMQRLILPMIDKFQYKHIPLEKLDCIQSNQIRLLYYICPSLFYVYLRENISSYISFQNDLQKVMQKHQSITTPIKYQPIAAQDNHAIWHRAVILDFTSDLTKICVYFIDIGQREYVSMNNIRQLPEEFHHKSALAIPCRLYNVYPINGNDQSIWESNDQVHDEFNRLMVNNVSCKVHIKQDQIIYDIEIDIPKIGDLGTFLFDKNLVSRTIMNNNLRPNFNSGQQLPQSFVRAQLALGTIPFRQQQRSIQQNELYNNPNNMTQQPQTRMSHTGLQNTNVQQSPNTLAITGSSSTISTLPPQDGLYTITQVHSAGEFYGVSQSRERELESLFKYLEEFYNNNSINDQLLSVNVLVEGTPCVVQQGDKYHRVLIKRRENDTRASVKLIDRGDEVIVDISELLQIEKNISSIPIFAQPFRLRGYDELQNSANLTPTLKKLILNQRVHITQINPMTINGFYPVEIILADNHSVNKILFSNEKNLLSPTSISNNRPSFNQSHHTYIESQVFSNSNKHPSTINQDLSGRLSMTHRTNDILSTSSNILTGPSRTQPGRFGTGNSTASVIPSTNEQIPRFTNLTNRNNQTVDSTTSNSIWNKEQTNKSNFNITNQQSFGRQQSSSSQFNNSQKTDDDKISMTNNNQNRLSSMHYDNQQVSYEQKRSFSSGYSHDDRNEKQMSGNHFQKNDDSSNESNFRRGGFNRGTGFPDRGARGGFNDRHMNRNNDGNTNDHNTQFSSGFSKRGGGFTDGGGRSGNFHDRNNFNRNQNNDYNENNMQRSQNFNNNNTRGGFQNRRDQGDNRDHGDFGRRGGQRGSQRGGNFDSSNRGGRSNFRDRDNIGLQLSSDYNNSLKTFNNSSNIRQTNINFEAGDHFIENDIPKDNIFKFVISHIETANDFFIQLLSKGNELTKLSEILQNEYQQAPEANISSLKINQPCLAKSSDDCWYRATVLLTGLTKLKVRFIDFGDTTEVTSNTIRQLEKKHCLAAPYAYQCKFENVQILDNVNINNIIDQCAGKEFNGKIKTKTLDNKFILESDDFLQILLQTNAIKSKPKTTSLKRFHCVIIHFECDKHEFFIQDNTETADKISELVQNEEPNAPTLTIDEVKQLLPNTMIIAMFDNQPYRAIIQSNESNNDDDDDDNINVYYVDYGNTNLCSKTSLKRCSEQLSSYPYQNKRCQLYGINLNEIDNAFKYVQENSDSENTEISIINEKNSLFNVLVYINNECINEKFGCDLNLIENNDNNIEIDNQPNIITSPSPPSPPPTITTIIEEQEQEQPISIDEKQTNDDVLSQNESPAVTQSENNESVTEKTLPEYRQGLLTYIEQTKPYVYIQLIPESEPIIEQINKLITKIIQDNQHNSSYEIGDHVIAQFSQDDSYYRARIESYLSSTNSYTVYFLDYGNLDENVQFDRLYSYSNELEDIEPQAHGYLLNKVDIELWNNTLYSLMDSKINDIIEYTIIDKNNSIIDIKFDNNNNNNNNIEQINSINLEENKTFSANISSVDNNFFYIHILPNDNLHLYEIEEYLQTYNKQTKDQWIINDLCIVLNNDNKYYRGQILDINDNKYNIRCIDYGYILENITNDYLFILSNDDEILKQLPLAHKCKLYGIDYINQKNIINDIIQCIPITESVTIHIENNDENNQCLYVTLIRENNDNVNIQCLSKNNIDTIEHENKEESDTNENNEIILSNSTDSINNIDEQKISQIENNNNNQSNDITNVTENSSLLSITNNQTIDFGENDSSTTNTTIKDEINDSISSN
ncbi:unnamed protein product [Rotaria sordida]|uniref:Tudor domain-containing protein n=1 Tax=Rotaria sordida TaxID=392033 RepID=A0A814J646_9BILA|nr:unnamed protein product [Rotaria sordida]CAF3586998.1 unnamed protein product [Rotaria sordida]